ILKRTLGTFRRPRAPINVLITRTVTRFVARLLIGALVFAQAAFATYVCPPAGGIAEAGAAHVMVAGSIDAGQTASSQTDVWQMDATQPNLCAAHCQSAQPGTGAKPAPVPPLALLAGYFSVAAVAPDATHGQVAVPFEGPPPLADPPHAILHCCFRI
ncbi:MAG: hypothetical protein ABIQ60_13835, partial [Burkholderiaceae bacterium]